MHPGKLGTGKLPRYGGGWMFQFGHVYALQQELLNPKANDWFHAVELWHTARHEGIALNSAHYTNILRQCVQPAQWKVAVDFLHHMRKEAIRPDVVGVGCAIAACAEAGEGEEAIKILSYYIDVAKILLDSNCFLGAARASNSAGRYARTMDVMHLQDREAVPLLPPNYSTYIEACDQLNDADCALLLVRRMTGEQYALPAADSHRVRQLCVRVGRSLQQWDEITEEGLLGGVERPLLANSIPPFQQQQQH